MERSKTDVRKPEQPADRIAEAREPADRPADRDYEKPKIVRVRRVLAAGGHSV